MRTFLLAAVAGFAAHQVAGHATWQELWVDGVDKISVQFHRIFHTPANVSHGSTCARLPLSNNPVTDVTSNDIACNAGTSPAAAKCSVNAGSVVTIEMHQQPNDRSCANEAIGGAHYGPVQVYMAKVTDASTAVGASSGWFKVFADTWANTGSSGSDDAWGTKDLNTCCGKMDVKIPTDIAPVLTCYQITVTGSGTASPATVKLPGAYAASNPGILINIYQTMTTYAAPGPTVYSGGSTKSAGAACAACESTCTAAAKRAVETAL
ncbi:hypothetical protein N0V82_005276 [Gnomoniopsis sp. IMI 355080]|nr:hypothetical protein N0V82_005276 [Gnomoniopsis sp. IMI 355080]